MIRYKIINTVFLLMALLYGNPGMGQNAENVLWTAAWSSDESLIAVGGADKVLRIYNGQSFELIRNDTLEEWILRLQWHPYRNILAVAANGDGSRLIDFDKNISTSLKGLNNAGTRALDWDREGSRLAVADYEGFVHIWNQDGQYISGFQKENSKSFTAIDWHPVEERLLILSEYVRDYNVEGKLIKKIQHRPEKALLLCVDWHPSGEFYSIGDYGDNDVPLPPLLQFYSSDHRLLFESAISKSEYRNISWNTEGTKLATASEILRIWSKNGQLLYSGPDEDDNIWGVGWNKRGTMLVTSSEKGHIKIWSDQAEMVKKLR